MATATTSAVTTLQGEIAQLQAGLDAAVERMRALDGGDHPNGRTTPFAAVERTWDDVKRQAQQVGQTIEERPLASTAAALGAGIALGLLFGVRRG